MGNIEIAPELDRSLTALQVFRRLHVAAEVPFETAAELQGIDLQDTSTCRVSPQVGNTAVLMTRFLDRSYGSKHRMIRTIHLQPTNSSVPLMQVNRVGNNGSYVARSVQAYPHLEINGLRVYSSRLDSEEVVFNFDVLRKSAEELAKQSRTLIPVGYGRVVAADGMTLDEMTEEDFATVNSVNRVIRITAAAAVTALGGANQRHLLDEMNLTARTSVSLSE